MHNGTAPHSTAGTRVEVNQTKASFSVFLLLTGVRVLVAGLPAPHRLEAVVVQRPPVANVGVGLCIMGGQQCRAGVTRRLAEKRLVERCCSSVAAARGTSAATQRLPSTLLHFERYSLVSACTAGSTAHLRLLGHVGVLLLQGQQLGAHRIVLLLNRHLRQGGAAALLQCRQQTATSWLQTDCPI